MSDRKRQTFPDGSPAREYDSRTGQTLNTWYDWEFLEHFHGSLEPLLSSASTPSGPWIESHTAGGALARVSDEPNGVVSLALTSTSEAQSARIDFGDHVCWDATAGFAIEFRMKPKVVVSATAVKWEFGVGDAGATAPASIVNRATFGVEFSTTVKLMVSTDDGSNVDENNDTGVDAPTSDDAYRILRIELWDLASVKFYVNGSRVLSGTTFVLTDILTTDLLQPFAHLYKASGATLGTMELDYVRAWGYNKV